MSYKLCDDFNGTWKDHIVYSLSQIRQHSILGLNIKQVIAWFYSCSLDKNKNSVVETEMKQ
jgi:hypothetical protein